MNPLHEELEREFSGKFLALYKRLLAEAEAFAAAARTLPPEEWPAAAIGLRTAAVDLYELENGAGILGICRPATGIGRPATFIRIGALFHGQAWQRLTDLIEADPNQDLGQAAGEAATTLRDLLQVALARG
jgi:hypothetical protein